MSYLTSYKVVKFYKTDPSEVDAGQISELNQDKQTNLAK